MGILYFKIALKNFFDIYFLISVLFPSLFIFFVDIPNLKRENLNKEAQIAKIIAITYIIVGPVTYLFFKII
ncbi:CLC_0170 family protein [Anaerosalibacter bizertensis]|uniref:CLC_0170 family protein n=1 Tax=Anaerosalibacter bizertensis TaxID=932217 RepID=UPI003518E8BC